MHYIMSLLRDKGFKATPQRIAVYSVLAQTKAHPSAEMIFSALQSEYPAMSLATVYKTIDILLAIGVIQILNVGEGSFRYDSNTTAHPHICCIKCGRVDDLEGIDSRPFTETAACHTAYQITGQQFYFYGICPACQCQLH